MLNSSEGCFAVLVIFSICKSLLITVVNNDYDFV
jgi:hypothetical protein